MTTWQLQKHPGFSGVRGPVLVVVMDGVGYGAHNESDAVWLARKPNLSRLQSAYPTARLAAHGVAVGMPSDADMGNSEVGHNALGAGRVFDQGAKLVQHAIDTGLLWERDTWKQLIKRSVENAKPLHFVGLLSDGNVHAHIGHLLKMLERASEEGVKQVRVHVLLDGRDVPETSAFVYVDQLEQVLAQINQSKDRDYRIASGGGRMFITMDRYEADWSMVERGWHTHVLGQGRKFKSAREAIETFRGEQPGIGDQNLPAFVIAGEGGEPVGRIEDGSSVVLFNFRGDRAIELSLALERDEFDKFARGRRPDVMFAGMMQYDGDTLTPKRFLVPPPAIENTLGEYLARNGVSQYASSETQKFGHVTYFWNGNRSGKFDDKLETYLEVRSDVAPFEERPWMKAAEITDKLIDALRSGKHRHLRVNYANGDMVGHTGCCEATVQAVEAVDLQIGRLLPVIQKLEGALIVTADHGNADEMFELNKKGEVKHDDDGRPLPKTSHTLNQVPFFLYAPKYKFEIDPSVPQPGLSNVAASVLHVLGFKAPADFRPSLVRGG
ncbi:MAG: 2,3-bisphosphoglycerate-independent phosphoglycerate mutase [Polyangiales bacterium]